MDVRTKAEAGRRAAHALLSSPDAARRSVLEGLSARLEQDAETLFAANAEDQKAARRDGVPKEMLDRLQFDAGKLESVADGCRQLAAMPDPLGRTLRSTVLDDGLHLYQVTCPIGVIACIFESRPDVVVQIAALAIRTGNAVLLKGGSEASVTNEALANVVRESLRATGLPTDAVQLLDGRAEVDALLAMDDLVDLIVPRGSARMVRMIQANTKIPVLGHAEGICHVYVDRAADAAKTVAIVADAKLDSPSACNAVETILVHEDRADLLPAIRSALRAGAVAIHEGDACRFDREYGSLDVNLATVPNIDAALAHIARYGSHHTDAIVTEDAKAARAFVAGVDAAGVFVNASTRFADGYRYGLGAEVGVATGRIHARGPVGLDGLLSYRWILVGHGHAAATYRRKAFRHEPSPTGFWEQWEAWGRGESNA